MERDPQEERKQFVQLIRVPVITRFVKSNPSATGTRVGSSMDFLRKQLPVSRIPRGSPDMRRCDRKLVVGANAVWDASPECRVMSDLHADSVQ